MRKKLRIQKPAFLLLILLILINSCSSTKPLRENGKAISGSVASLEKVTLGSLDQWILIRGKSVENPIILFLHGGPGMPEMALAKKEFQKQLENHFIVVHWDQRGAGKTYSKKTPVETMNIEQFLADTHQLIEILVKRFNKEKIFLIGHSWGSILGLVTCQRHPELIYAYIGMGQVVNVKELKKYSYELTLNKAREVNHSKAIAELEKIGPPPFQGKEENILGKWRLKLGGMIYNESGWWAITKNNLFSKEYTFVDNYYKFMAGIKFTNKYLTEEIQKIDFSTQITSVDIPVYFFCGRHDYATPPVLVEQYIRILDAPVKEIIWFDNSAHMMNISEPGKCADAILSIF